MQFRRFLFVSLLLALAACSSAEKFPYPPQFVDRGDVPPTVLDSPPAVGSPEFKKALKTVLSRQAVLTPKQIAVLRAEDKITPEMIVLPVLGPQVTEANYPELYTHLQHVASDAWRISDAAQDYWGSPRPWTVEPKVKVHVSHITRPGYPSGHTVTNRVLASALSDLVPCKKSAFIARANAIADHRLQAGAHFPFDVAAGKKLGDAIYGKMKLTVAYQREHERVRSSLHQGQNGQKSVKWCGAKAQ